MNHLEKIADAIKKRMREKRLKPKQVYKKANVSDSFFYKLFAGTAPNASLNHVQSVLDVLELEFDIVPKGSKDQAALPIFCNDGYFYVSCKYCGGSNLEAHAVRIAHDRTNLDVEVYCNDCNRTSKCCVNTTHQDGKQKSNELDELKKAIDLCLKSASVSDFVGGALQMMLKDIILGINHVRFVEEVVPHQFANEAPICALAACDDEGHILFYTYVHIGAKGFMLRLLDQNDKVIC